MTTPLRNKALGGMLTPIFDEAPWMEHAACRPHGPDLWFSLNEPDIAQALAICNGCPVADECLQHAQRLRIQDGVWGGHTAAERVNLRVGRPPTTRCRCGNRILNNGRWGKAKTLCLECSASAAADRKARKQPPPPPPRQCEAPGCGMPAKPKDKGPGPNPKYCSNQCQHKAHRSKAVRKRRLDNAE